MRVKLSARTIQKLKWVAEDILDSSVDSSEPMPLDLGMFVDWVEAQSVVGGTKEIPDGIAKTIFAELSNAVDVGEIQYKHDLNSVELALGYYMPHRNGDVFSGGRISKKSPDLVREGVKYDWIGGE